MARGVTGVPSGAVSRSSLRISHAGSSGNVVTVRSAPPSASAGSTRKAQSTSTSQSRVCATVCIDWGSETPARGHRRTVVPSPSHRTTCTSPVSGCERIVQRQARSGSTAGWAVDGNIGRTGAPKTSSPHRSRWPTSPRNRSETGSTSTGRPASHVAKSRPSQGRGAVLAALAKPNGDDHPMPLACHTSGRAARSRRLGVSSTAWRQANLPAGAPWVPGVRESRIMIPSPKNPWTGAVARSEVETKTSPPSPSGQTPDRSSRSRSVSGASSNERGSDMPFPLLTKRR